jgi:hypothetical protein
MSVSREKVAYNTTRRYEMAKRICDLTSKNKSAEDIACMVGLCERVVVRYRSRPLKEPALTSAEYEAVRRLVLFEEKDWSYVRQHLQLGDKFSSPARLADAFHGQANAYASTWTV